MYRYLDIYNRHGRNNKQCLDKNLQVWKNFEFWCEGVLFSSFGLFGLVSNLASIVTFLSADMRKHTFNQLLASLAVYDIL
jgi:hypothetical protein